MKRALLLLAGSVLVFVGLVLAVGFVTPVAHSAARRASFSRPPSAVYAAITDIKHASSWRIGLESVELLPERDGRRCYREHTSDGPLLFVVEEDVPDRRVVTRLADPELPFGGAWRFELEPSDTDCVLTITEEGEIYNVVFRGLARLIFGHTTNIERCFESLGKKFAQPVRIGDPLQGGTGTL